MQGWLRDSQNGFESAEVRCGNLIKIQRTSSRAKAFLPFEQAVIESATLLFVTAAKIEKQLLMVMLINQPVDEEIEGAELAASLRGRNVLRVRHSRRLIDSHPGNDFAAIVDRELLDVVWESTRQDGDLRGGVNGRHAISLA